jgi:hypothetical protein
MSDMGIPFPLKKATEGMAEGDPKAIKDLHSPGDQGTPEAVKQHAHASTSQDDPPIEMGGGHHGHRGNPKKN